MYALLNGRLKLVVMVALLPWLPDKTLQGIWDVSDMSLTSKYYVIHNMLLSRFWRSARSGMFGRLWRFQSNS